jgi:hypothetical protein
MILISRKARDSYIDDITHFRVPKGTLSTYYQWRVKRFANALIEAIVFLTVLVSAVLLLAYYSNLLAELMDVIVIVVFVLGLAGLSSAQIVWRVRQVIEKERDLVLTITATDDLIGNARIVVDDLYRAQEAGDGHTWFALFKIAQISNPLGYSVRDVLIEKGKSVVRKAREEEKASREYSSSDQGLHIQ